MCGTLAHSTLTELFKKCGCEDAHRLLFLNWCDGGARVCRRHQFYWQWRPLVVGSSPGGWGPHLVGRAGWVWLVLPVLAPSSGLCMAILWSSHQLCGSMKYSPFSAHGSNLFQLLVSTILRLDCIAPFTSSPPEFIPLARIAVFLFYSPWLAIYIVVWEHRIWKSWSRRLPTEREGNMVKRSQGQEDQLNGRRKFSRLQVTQHSNNLYKKVAS